VARGAGAAVGGVEGVVGVVGAGCWRACHVPSVVWLRLAGSDRSLRGASCGRAHAGMRAPRWWAVFIESHKMKLHSAGGVRYRSHFGKECSQTVPHGDEI
jgi:hypothetical protein